MAHEHGSMDTKVQEQTFVGFTKWLTWGTVVCVLVLIFMALVNA